MRTVLPGRVRVQLRLGGSPFIVQTNQLSLSRTVFTLILLLCRPETSCPCLFFSTETAQHPHPLSRSQAVITFFHHLTSTSQFVDSESKPRRQREIDALRQRLQCYRDEWEKGGEGERGKRGTDRHREEINWIRWICSS